jgi:hypothetical protein
MVFARAIATRCVSQETLKVLEDVANPVMDPKN